MNEPIKREVLALLAEVHAHLEKTATERLAADAAHAARDELMNEVRVLHLHLASTQTLFNRALAREAAALAALEEAGETETAQTLKAARSVSITEASGPVALDPRHVWRH